MKKSTPVAIIKRYQSLQIPIASFPLLSELNSFIMPYSKDEVSVIAIPAKKITQVVVKVEKDSTIFIIQRPNLYEYAL